MANMSYCRFENTYRDLMDCFRNMDNGCSDREHKYRKQIIELCERIVDDYGSMEWEEDERDDDNDEE